MFSCLIQKHLISMNTDCNNCYTSCMAYHSVLPKLNGLKLHSNHLDNFSMTREFSKKSFIYTFTPKECSNKKTTLQCIEIHYLSLSQIILRLRCQKSRRINKCVISVCSNFCDVVIELSQASALFITCAL